ncbi:MAG: hypothetical protein ACK5MT_01655 [Actinomycetales bacterium]
MTTNARRLLGVLLICGCLAWYGFRFALVPVGWRTGMAGLAGTALAWACLLGGTWLLATAAASSSRARRSR